MPQLVVDKQYQDGSILTEDHLDAAFDSIETLLNTTGLGADNIQDNSIGPNELQTSAVSETKLATNSVATSKIQDNAVTKAKLAAAVQALLVPTGSVMHYAGDTAPTGWLICDGGAVSRTTYADLFNLVGIRFGQGDGTTTFNLPDGRGRVIRMVDGSAGNDPDSAARTAMGASGATGNNIGSVQGDELKAHTHTSNATTAYQTSGTGVQSNTGLQINFGALTTSSTGGNETRMKNWNANLIIKT
jgi:microcystin-dependent protein